MQSLRWSSCLVALALAVCLPACGADPLQQAAASQPVPPAQLTAEQDHQRTMELLHIPSLRAGANGSNPQAPNAANYDESKANPYPKLPDSLVLKNGKKVTSAQIWWQQRRPEIVEAFDREIYGRVPREIPKVNWEVTSTSTEVNNASTAPGNAPRNRAIVQ